LPTRFGLPYAAHGLPGRSIWAVCHCAGLYETQTSPSSSYEPNFYWDDFWGVAGLRAGAELLRAVDQPDAAAEAERFAAAMWEDWERSLQLTAERLGTITIPAGPRRRVDPGASGSPVACAPLDLFSADDPRIAATADDIRQRFTLAEGHAFFQGISHTGSAPT
jgi:GH15 family glucan-1,4-alpha-glucosidase